MTTAHVCPDRQGRPGDELDCPVCVAALADPAQAVIKETWTQEHETEASVFPYVGQPGGIWQVRCSCGWFLEGTYARDGFGERTAGRLARSWADRHRKNPGVPG